MQDTVVANPTQTASTSHPMAELFQDPALAARRTNVAGGHAVCEADEPATNVYVVHRGQVRLYQPGPDGSQRLVEILGPNEWFGVAALAKADQHGMRAVAVGPTVISEVRADKLFQTLSTRPEALVELSRQLANKVQSARDEAANLIFKDCNNRLIETLVKFSKSAAATPNEDGVVLR